MYPWRMGPFIILIPLSLCDALFISDNFPWSKVISLSKINIATSAFFWSVLAWYILLYLL